MALDRFTNDEVLGYTPVIGETLDTDVKERIDKQELSLTEGEINGNLSFFEQYTPNKEVHIYSDTSLIKSQYNGSIQYTNGQTPNVYVKPERDLRDLGIEQGVYSIVYNFLARVTPNIKIDSISADRTEVRLVSSNNTSDTFEGLYVLSSATATSAFLTNGVHKDYVLNFGEDNMYDILNLAVEGPRVGVIQDTLSYPTSTITIDGSIYPTVFVPHDEVFEAGPGTWRGMVEVIAPAIGSSNPYVGQLTGRAKNYELQYKLTGNGELKWNAGAADHIYPNWPSSILNNFDLGGMIESAFYYSGNDSYFNIDFNSTYLTYKRFDNTLTSKDVLILKLSRPLGLDIFENDICNVDARLMRSIVEKIIAFPAIESEDKVDFSQPNFALDISENNTSGTEFRSWETLLDVNATTQNELVQTYLSSSFGNIKLNIDYSDFSNFIHFSSATERIDNFKYKLEQIESYDARIELLESVSGSDALTNISQSIVRKNRILNGFDEFERYMYYSEDSNNYTHWSSSANLIEPYPKSSTYPHILRATTSNEGEGWYAGVYASASLYDEFNDARLRNMIPIHLQEDERNLEYTTFVDMIGQHFDVQWTYIKSLTDVNRREEHPQDGLADELLQSVAESLGWRLSNGYTDVDLWKYALGVEEDGTLYQSGSLKSKPREQIVHETWRRIVNTLPMLYKTKGTARSIKALLSTYGIPQTFLQIREFGGPTIPSRKNIYEHERFINKLEVSATEYLSNPWGTIDSVYPHTIEVIEKLPKDDHNILVLKSGGIYSDYNLFWEYDSQNNRGRLRLKENDTNTVAITDYVPYLNRKDSVIMINSASDAYEIGISFVDDFGEILASETAEVGASNVANFVGSWVNATNVYIGSGSTDSTASLQEVRYYNTHLSEEILQEHAKNREAYFSDDNTTDLDIDTAFDTLVYRIFPDSGFTTNSSSISSLHPNQDITETDGGVILSASVVNMTPSNLVGEVDTMFQTVPSVGALNLMNNKIRIESATLNGPLNPDKSNEISDYDYAPNDSNLLGTYFSTTDVINNDIYNSEGYFEADDWVGDPDKRYNESYPMLRYKMKNYFQKYTGKTAVGLILDILARYDMSVFDQIKQLLPARVDWHKGILIEPHALERSKFQRPRDITISKLMYDGTIQGVGNRITGSYPTYTSSIDLYDYQPSVYLHPSSSGDNYTYSNGYWEYSPTGSVVVNARPSAKYQTTKLFFSSEVSASLNLPNSSSYEYARVQDDRLSLSMENLYYNGCRVSSDSLTTDSTDTPDGGPVVVVTEADPTVLVFGAESSNNGTLQATDSPVDTQKVVRSMPRQELVSVRKADAKSKNQPRRDKVSEVKATQPLPFIAPKRSRKVGIRRDGAADILRSILRRKK